MRNLSLSFITAITIFFSAAALFPDVAFADMEQCSSLFDGNYDRRSEIIAVLREARGPMEIRVTWVSLKPFSYQDFNRLDDEAARNGVTITSLSDQQNSLSAKWPLTSGFVNSGFANIFTLHGDAQKISDVLGSLKFTDTRIVEFELVGDKSGQQSTEFATLHIASRDARGKLIRDFLLQRHERILLINDVDSRSFISLIEAPLLNAYTSSPLEKSGSIELAIKNWDRVVADVNEGRHFYVRTAQGREFFIVGLDTMISIQSKISERNRMGSVPELAVKKIEPVVIEPTAIEPVAKISSPARTAPEKFPVIVLQDFHSQESRAVDALFVPPSRGGTEFKVLRLDRERLFYVLNPYWFGKTKVGEIIATLQSRNPSFPPISKETRKSLADFSTGKGLENRLYTERSYWSLTGSFAEKTLFEDHAIGKTVVFTERDHKPVPYPEVESARLRYVFVPIPKFEFESEGIGYSEFMLHRLDAIGPLGRQPLNKQTPVRVLQKQGVGAYFYIVSADYLRTADPQALVQYMKRQFSKLPPLTAADLQFVEAIKNGAFEQVPHSPQNLKALSGVGANLVYETAWQKRLPIVAKRYRGGHGDDVEFVLIPIHPD